MLTNRKLLLSGLAVSLIAIIITEPLFDFLHSGVFNQFESTFLEPVFFWSLAVTIASLVLMFFSREVFSLWFKNIFRWLLPVGLVITFLADPNMSVTFPDRAGVAMLLGEVLVVTTLVFALVQKFYYKR